MFWVSDSAAYVNTRIQRARSYNAHLSRNNDGNNDTLQGNDSNKLTSRGDLNGTGGQKSLHDWEWISKLILV